MKRLWCFIWLVFEGSIHPYMHLFSSENFFVTLSSGLETGGAIVHALETDTVTEGPVLVPHADGDPIPGKNNQCVGNLTPNPHTTNLE